MRVLFITGEFPPMQGGVGDCTNETAKALLALGVDVRVVTSSQAVSDQPSAVSVLPVIEKWNWSCLRRIVAVMCEFAPDIIHIQYQTGAYGMHPAINFLPRYFRPRAGDEGRALRCGVKPRPCVVTTFHDLRVPYLFPKAGRVRDWVTRELARSCDAVIATNEVDYSKLETWNVRLATLIPIGSNITTTPPADYDRAAWRTQLGVGEHETLLCYFGFLNESKGGETLVRALAQISNAKLLMIGGQVGASDPTNAAYLAKVKLLISELGLAERVLWTDFAPQEIVTAHFLACDICVMPYREGASYRHGTLMAALAHGMPIVTTQVKSEKLKVKSALPALQDGENCLLVAPDDPVALALAVRRVAESPELRAKIGTGARQLADHFTWDKIAQQHLALYEQLAHL